MILHSPAIYGIINMFDNKMYVGSAVDLKRRWSEHKTRLRANSHHNQLLQRAWNKYGEQLFKFQILEYIIDTDLLDAEIYWINLTKSLNRSFGYNLCVTGKNHLGLKRSKQTCEKISNALKGKTIPIERKIAISNSLKGRKRLKESIEKTRLKLTGQKRKPRSKEWIEKLRQANIGRKPSEETKAKIMNSKFWKNKYPKFVGPPTFIITAKGN